MVSACKQYITEGGHVRVWDVPPATLLQRLDSCKKLYQHYQECFNQSKQHMRSSHRPFEISEMYIFGKFASFCRRLDQIRCLVDTMQQFSVLQQSHIERDRVPGHAFQPPCFCLQEETIQPPGPPQDGVCCRFWGVPAPGDRARRTTVWFHGH